jgi:hypothetical protein
MDSGWSVVGFWLLKNVCWAGIGVWLIEKSRAKTRAGKHWLMLAFGSYCIAVVVWNIGSKFLIHYLRR